MVNAINDLGSEIALFSLFEALPLGTLLSLLAILLISTFFITSADSATFVLGMQTTHGSLNPAASVKIIWGLILAAAAAVLLATGGLEGLQMASIIAAFPFTFVLIGMGVSLFVSLRREYSTTKRTKTA